MNKESELAHVNQLCMQGRFDRARENCAKILAAQPDRSDACLMMGRIEFQLGNINDAILQLKRAVELNPESADIREELGKAFVTAGRFNAAVAEFQEEIRLRPDNPDSFFRLSRALHGNNNFPKCENALRAAIALRPDFEDAERTLVNIVLSDNRFFQAIQLMEEFLRRHPDDLVIQSKLVFAYEKVSRIDDAERLATQFLERSPGHPEVELIMAMLEGRRGDLEEAERRLRRLIGSGNTGKMPWTAYYRLGAILDRRGAYSDAFATCVKANRLSFDSIAPAQRKAGNYTKIVAKNRAWIESYDGNTGATAPDDRIRSPVFFVGFPRSGTTLMETILASHPDAITTEEYPFWSTIVPWLRAQRGSYQDLTSLTPGEIAGVRGKYMELAESRIGRPVGQALLIDKLPLNIVKLPQIRTIFPDSRLIVAIRDPRDVCLSCFMQSFNLNGAMEHFLDIHSTARLYSEVMPIWLKARDCQLLNNIEYRYEDLVDDVYGKTKEILHAIGLDWNDEILQHTEKANNRNIGTPSYHAVRNPISKNAIGRWKNYAEQLAPILPILEPFVTEFGYEPS